MEIKNAIIEKATLTIVEGCLSAWVFLDYGGCGQGFGGFALYFPKSFRHYDPKTPNYAGHFIWRVLKIAGVENWSDLKGKTVRVKGDFTRIEAIGHIVKNDWFDPKKEFEEMVGG